MVRTIAVLGNYVPRQCGIATFTTDLTTAIATEYAATNCFVLAMNDAGKRHVYPPRVRFEIAETDIPSYRRAADFLNVGAVDVLCVQHEYGIFGGPAGSHLLELLSELRMPIVTTLHTVLANPSSAQRAVMDALTRLSERVVIMSDHGAELLRKVHGVAPSRIDVIPHGIPDVPFAGHSKDQLGLQGKAVILTFGLLSPDKGIEHVIDSLPAILERHPETVYVVLGATHPHVKDRHGETYRLMLEDRARHLGVDSSVIFHNRFVSHAELTEFLCAADIYITPYLNPEQITSGTLAYAVGAGKAVLSTPYRYARDLLADGRGILVPWPAQDPRAIALEVSGLLDDEGKRLALRQRAYAHGRSMVWPAVARAYVQTCRRACQDHAERMRTTFRARVPADRSPELPHVDLTHLHLLTDSTGILQHAAYNVPRYEDGYCLDDNARALLLTTVLEAEGARQVQEVRVLASRYLAFVRHAFNPETRRFRNFMSYTRRFTEERGSEDSHGRALWALGTVVGRAVDPGRQSLANELFHGGLAPIASFSSPRAWAFTLLGIHEYLKAFQGDSVVQSLRRSLTGRLNQLLQINGKRDWPWFEDRLTYENARLSEALFVSGSAMDNHDMVDTGIRSLEWLASLQRSKDGYFAPIGCNGFHGRGGPRADFDQQPVEAFAMVSAFQAARRVTGVAKWTEQAHCAFNWFLGQNQVQRPLYDPTTGGCRDGLHADRPNENQGAESTLSFLLALVEMRSAARSSESIAAAGAASVAGAVRTGRAARAARAEGQERP